MREFDLLPAPSSSSAPSIVALTADTPSASVLNDQISSTTVVNNDTGTVPVIIPSTDSITTTTTMNEEVKMNSRPASFSQLSNAPRNSRSVSKPPPIEEGKVEGKEEIKIPPVEEAPAPISTTAASTDTYAAIIMDLVVESKPVEMITPISSVLSSTDGSIDVPLKEVNKSEVKEVSCTPTDETVTDDMI